MRKRISTRRLFAISLLVLGIFAASDALIRDAAAQAAGAQSAHLYFFTNDGCAPCRQVEPGIEALKREGYPVTTVKLNDHPQWGTQFRVDRTPTVVLVNNKQVVGRHAGLIDGVTLKKWFAHVGVHAGSNFAATNGNRAAPGGTKVVLSEANTAANRSSLASTYTRASAETFSTATMIAGTDQPRTESERLALQATVRLKVEDPEGISYATGTVIHNHEGECLVITCGHVFRDSQGTGEITAEYGFGTGNVRTGPGQLISFDAKARDIAVVAIRTDTPIIPVKIATRRTSIDRGRDIFSIGCDHGESPTIRHSRIKNRAAYDGAIKYDIYGRPVDGRSGGGLFTSDGRLVGVCNAAAVEVDEGIYTALDTIYWQLAKVNLDHLFDDQRAIRTGVPVDLPQTGAASQTFAMAENNPRSRAGGTSPVSPNSRLGQIRPRPADSAQRTGVSWDRQSDQSDREVIIIVRSKSDPSRAEAITVSDPTPGLLKYLDDMKSDVTEPRQLDLARLRQQHAQPR